MKKIINGRRYDTDRAKEVGYDYYSNPGDFSYWRETLYRKNTGEFFSTVVVDQIHGMQKL